jgi:hypothetical protein
VRLALAFCRIFGPAATPETPRRHSQGLNDVFAVPLPVLPSLSSLPPRAADPLANVRNLSTGSNYSCFSNFFASQPSDQSPPRDGSVPALCAATIRGSAVDPHALQHLPTFADAHAVLVGDIGIPYGTSASMQMPSGTSEKACAGLVGASVSANRRSSAGSGAVYWAMISQIVATFACGVFFGAAVYINLVEQPARISCGTPLALTQWRPSYKRGTLMQAPLALIGSISALIAWRFEGTTAWLVGDYSCCWLFR